MRIALDAMGGDYAPGPNILGALEAVELNPGLEVLLVGDRARLEEELQRTGPLPAAVRIVESEGWVGMDEKPTTALREKPNCSIARCWQLMAQGLADAVVSAGHTGCRRFKDSTVSQGCEASRDCCASADSEGVLHSGGRGCQP
jgi:glycerol-3-phosphate acyltransferase PlsX